MNGAAPDLGEWRRSWPIVLGCSIAGGTGAGLLFYVISLFTLPMAEDFGATRGELASFSAFVALGALSAPALGWLTDRFGARRVFAICMAIVAGVHVMTATLIDSVAGFAVSAALLGLFGVGTGPVVYTRIINGWFDSQRGLALGLGSLGLSVVAVFAPPLLAALIAAEGWRAGYWALALISLLIGLPTVLLLTRDPPVEKPPIIDIAHPSEIIARPFLKTRDFWLLGGSIILMAIPGAGFISQMSPLVQEEGATAAAAAWGVSAYAAGQIAGRVISGALLDRFNPQWVAFLFTAIPAIGFALLAIVSGSYAIAIFAAAMIGIQQGSEVDLFAYFVSRRFGMAGYGAVYGSILGLSWVGNVIGVVGFGLSYDATGSYVAAEIFGALSLVAAAATIAMVRIDRAA